MRARWGSLPVRRRLIIAIAALVGATLLLSGLTLWLVESRRIDRNIDAEITREFAEFRAAFSPTEQVGADERLDQYLARTLPEDGEILWTFPAASGPKYIGEQDANLVGSAAFTRLVEDLRDEGGLRTFRAGGTQYRVGVLPVRQGDRSAALVVTHDRSNAQARLTELLTTYALVGVLCLVIVVAASSWLAGRLLAPLTRLRDTAATSARARSTSGST